ncbi:MAG: IS1182 family transposase [Actinomycetota bacterium]
MAFNFIPFDRNQEFLLPPSLSDWLPQGHLARFICEVVDQLNLKPFYKRHRNDGWGRAAYDPKMMVALLLYSYCVGCRSSRAIERRCIEDVAFRYICANQTPDHATIARFRSEHESALSGLFTQALRLCFAAGLGKVGTVAVDGTKVKANASMSSNKTTAAIEQEVKKMLEEAKSIDAAEDKDYQGGNDLPDQMKSSRKRLDNLLKAKKRLEAEDRKRQADYRQKQAERKANQQKLGGKLKGRAPKPPKQPERPAVASITDPDSRILKSPHWFIQGYNAQAVVSEDQIVIAADVTNQATDTAQLHPMLTQAKEDLKTAGSDRKIKVLLADAGYYSEDNLKQQDEGPELLVATNKGWKHRKQAQKNPPKGRTPAGLNTRQRMERKLETKRGQRLYKKRGQTVEPVFGQHSERGFSEFLRRGVESCRCDWRLENTAHNLLKLWRAGKQGQSSRVLVFGRPSAGIFRCRRILCCRSNPGFQRF